MKQSHRPGWVIAIAVCAMLLLAPKSSSAQYNPHPRIWLTPERVSRIQTQHVAANSYEWQELLTCAERDDMDGARCHALAYVVTDDETHAQAALARVATEMAAAPVMTVAFNSNGGKFNRMALVFDWLYHSPHFTAELKQQLIDYVSAVPQEGTGKWNWYPDITYMNGVAKALWGPPLWGLATFGDNPLAQDYIDNGYEHRWVYIRNALGYGPANIAVVRGGCMPQGMDYGSGTMLNILRFADAWLTATGEDLFDEGPALRQFLEYFAKSYYYTPDFIRRPEHGHNAHKGGTYFAATSAAVLIAANRYADTTEAAWANWWMTQIEGASEWPGRDNRYFAVEDVIFSDHQMASADPTSEPLAYFAEGNGMWICRSDWTSGATEVGTYATFRAGNWTWFNQNHWDQGNYTIRSHGADLLVDAGIYDGGGDHSTGNFHHQTIAHNCITVMDPAQSLAWNPMEYTEERLLNSGGQNTPWRETLDDAVLDGEAKDPSAPYTQGNLVHDASDILCRTHNERYTHAFADMTNAYANSRWEQQYDAGRLANVDYRPKVTNVRRHWIYLRQRGSDDQEYFAAFDRVDAVDGSFQKKNLLHFIGEPVFPDGARQEAEVEGHIETWAANRFEMEHSGAVLHGAVVLPTGATIRKVGGRGYEYWVQGENWDPFPTEDDDLGGVWRLEIMPPSGQQADLFLNVLHPDSAGSAAPDVRAISATGFEGASFDGWVLLFANEEAIRTEALYAVEMDGAQRHLVFDMEGGYTYQVYRDGDPTPIADVSTGDGCIVEFEAPGSGTYQITQGDPIPVDPNLPETGTADEGGCGCRTAGSSHHGLGGAAWLALVALLSTRRRRPVGPCSPIRPKPGC